jgi:hypothetical protein
MLHLYFPLLYLDGMLEMYETSLCMWQRETSEPVIIILEEEPLPSLAEAA